MKSHDLAKLRKMKHLCIECGEPAEPRGENGFFTKCEKCREKAKLKAVVAGKAGAKKRNEYKPTLCWRCKNAVPDAEGKVGCNWSRYKLPVDGWTATPTRLKLMQKVTVRSYLVEECSEFKEG